MRREKGYELATKWALQLSQNLIEVHINQETVVIEYDTIYAREMYEEALQKNTQKKLKTESCSG